MISRGLLLILLRLISQAHYSRPCCSGWFITEPALLALQEKPLPPVSQEGYRIVHLAFATLRHPEMLGVEIRCI
jgi:hypothetical protein